MKTRTKVFMGIIAIILSVVLAFTIFTVNVNTNQVVGATTRTVVLNNNTVDYASFFNEFEDAELEIDEANNALKFSGTKKLGAELFKDIDLVGLSNSDDGVDVRYTFDYNANENEFQLSVIANVEEGIIIDKWYGAPYVNNDNAVDIAFATDDGIVYLSELEESRVLENCGWLSNLWKAAVAVAVVAVVAAVIIVAAPAVATAGAAVGGTTRAIVGAIDGEVSFGQVCANFGAGLLVGAATGALTGLIVGKIACYNVAFSKASFSSVNDCVAYHFGKHGAEVGASNASQYIKMAMDTARQVIKTGAAPVRAVAGATANVMRYQIGNYYIHMAIEGTKIIIVSFGLL